MWGEKSGERMCPAQAGEPVRQSVTVPRSRWAETADTHIGLVSMCVLFGPMGQSDITGEREHTVRRE